MYTKEEVEDQKDMAREDKAAQIRTDIIEWWRNERKQHELLNNLLRALGMKVVLVPYLVRVFYLDLLVQEIVVDAMGAEHARRQVCDFILIDENVLRIPIKYTGVGIAVNGRGSAIEIPADQCISDDAWTFEASRSLNYEGIGA